VLDGEAEASVRIAQPAIDVVFERPTALGGRLRSFVAVASVLTGERVGDASQFVLEGPEFRGASALSGRVVRVAVRGAVFADVPFQWEGDSMSGQPVGRRHVPRPRRRQNDCSLPATTAVRLRRRVGVGASQSTHA
jgi:hypothetical protein